MKKTNVATWGGKFSAPASLFQQGNMGHIPGLRLNEETVVGPIDAHLVVARRKGMAFIGPPRPVCPEVADQRLFKYQREGVALLEGIIRQTGGGLLTDEMGLGKSAQAIAVAHQLQAQLVVVVCPASVRETWKEQLQRWAWKDAFLLTSGKQVDAGEVPSTGWIITSYELAGRLTCYPDLVIFDEAQAVKGRAFKNRGPNRVRVARGLCTSSGARLLMTGTPMWDRPRDLWTLLDLTWPGRFGSSFDFDAAYCGGHFDAHGGWENKGVDSERLHELKLRLKMLSVSRTKEVVKDQLPDVMQTVAWLPPEAKATAVFRRFCLKQSTVQVALEACFEFKTQAAVELAQGSTDFLLVTWMKSYARELFHDLQKAGVTGVQYIDGEVSHAQRQARIKQAQAFKQQGVPTGIVATIDSLSAGVDGIQHVTSNGIFHALHNVPTVMAQTVARLHRIGQKNAVQWTWLALRDSIEEPLVNHLIHKMEAQMKVTGSLNEMRNAFVDSEADEAAVLKELYNAL